MEEQTPSRIDISKREAPLLNLTIFSFLITGVGALIALLILFMLKNPAVFSSPPSSEETIVTVSDDPDFDLVENGVHVVTGFIAEGDYELVATTCTACHSSKLVLQNRATREGWKDMIVWMQETQKLWDLGPNEDKILDYLATYLGPENKGRRAQLTVEEWYVIE